VKNCPHCGKPLNPVPVEELNSEEWLRIDEIPLSGPMFYKLQKLGVFGESKKGIIKKIGDRRLASNCFRREKVEAYFSSLGMTFKEAEIEYKKRCDRAHAGFISSPPYTSWPR
jgi:hypothetical protein